MVTRKRSGARLSKAKPPPREELLEMADPAALDPSTPFPQKPFTISELAEGIRRAMRPKSRASRPQPRVPS